VSGQQRASVRSRERQHAAQLVAAESGRDRQKGERERRNESENEIQDED
jgi:hypothetical protein